MGGSKAHIGSLLGFRGAGTDLVLATRNLQTPSLEYGRWRGIVMLGKHGEDEGTAVYRMEYAIMVTMQSFARHVFHGFQRNRWMVEGIHSLLQSDDTIIWSSCQGETCEGTSEIL